MLPLRRLGPLRFCAVSTALALAGLDCSNVPGLHASEALTQSGVQGGLVVDLVTQRVSYIAGGQTVAADLQRPLKSITHVGYVTDNALVDFADVQIQSEKNRCPGCRSGSISSSTRRAISRAGTWRIQFVLVKPNACDPVFILDSRRRDVPPNPRRLPARLLGYPSGSGEANCSPSWPPSLKLSPASGEDLGWGACSVALGHLA